jgi:hypothetical protein
MVYLTNWKNYILVYYLVKSGNLKTVINNKNVEMIEELVKSGNEMGYNHILYDGEVYGYYDEGLTRRVYVNSDRTRVIKVLINVDGINYNQEEHEIYLKSGNKDEMAYTEISSDGMVIIQEYVMPIKKYEFDLTLKDIKFALSCRNEVGLNSDGKLVCYDLSEYRKY